MMKGTLDNKIQVLIETYAFGELSDKDQQYVLSHISEEEYQSFYRILQETKILNADAPSHAPNFIFNNLKQEVANHGKTSETGFRRISNTKVPLWLVACLALLCFFLWPKDKNIELKEITPSAPIAKEEVPEPIYIYKTDTIIKEIKAEPIYIIKEVEKPIYIVQASEESQSVPLSNEVANLPANMEQTIDIVPFNKVGRSIADDKELMDLLVKVN